MPWANFFAQTLSAPTCSAPRPVGKIAPRAEGFWWPAVALLDELQQKGLDSDVVAQNAAITVRRTAADAASSGGGRGCPEARVWGVGSPSGTCE